jgi:hypothetical protein
MIDERIFDELVAEFRREDAKGGYEERRREWWGKLGVKELITEEGIERLDPDAALWLYKNVGWGAKLYPRSFLESGIDSIKKALKYLLYGADPVEKRFFHVVDSRGDLKLAGAAREFASFLLCMRDPKSFAIWNGAVDAGLKMLGFLPARTRGEHVGVTYTKICQACEDVRQRAGFADLQATDEFIELIAHGIIGAEIFGASGQEPVEPETEPEAKEHTRLQWMLVKIGKMEGHDVWVATNDRARSYKKEVLGELCLKELPHFAGPQVLRIAQAIDVIWFKRNTAQPVGFFEIETTTSIYSGLLRLNDVRIDYPIPLCSIVGPQNRQPEFERQLARRSFMASGLAEVCTYLTTDQVRKLYQAEEERVGILGHSGGVGSAL